MKTLSIQNILSNWSFMKILKLGLGTLVLIQAIHNHDTAMAMFGGIFMLQALLNIGCCGPNGCAVPVNKKALNKEVVSFTEITNTKEK